MIYYPEQHSRKQKNIAGVSISLDLGGDGIINLEFLSKMNTIGGDFTSNQ
jgi:hypothetical protein